MSTTNIQKGNFYFDGYSITSSTSIDDLDAIKKHNVQVIDENTVDFLDDLCYGGVKMRARVTLYQSQKKRSNFIQLYPAQIFDDPSCKAGQYVYAPGKDRKLMDSSDIRGKSSCLWVMDQNKQWLKAALPGVTPASESEIFIHYRFEWGWIYAHCEAYGRDDMWKGGEIRVVLEPPFKVPAGVLFDPKNGILDLGGYPLSRETTSDDISEIQKYDVIVQKLRPNRFHYFPDAEYFVRSRNPVSYCGEKIKIRALIKKHGVLFALIDFCDTDHRPSFSTLVEYNYYCLNRNIAWVKRAIPDIQPDYEAVEGRYLYPWALWDLHACGISVFCDGLPEYGDYSGPVLEYQFAPPQKYATWI